jgi:hypothetical protein
MIESMQNNLILKTEDNWLNDLNEAEANVDSLGDSFVDSYIEECPQIVPLHRIISLAQKGNRSTRMFEKLFTSEKHKNNLMKVMNFPDQLETLHTNLQDDEDWFQKVTMKTYERKQPREIVEDMKLLVASCRNQRLLIQRQDFLKKSLCSSSDVNPRHVHWTIRALFKDSNGLGALCVLAEIVNEIGCVIYPRGNPVSMVKSGKVITKIEAHNWNGLWILSPVDDIDVKLEELESDEWRRKFLSSESMRHCLRDEYKNPTLKLYTKHNNFVTFVHSLLCKDGTKLFYDYLEESLQLKNLQHFPFRVFQFEYLLVLFLLSKTQFLNIDLITENVNHSYFSIFNIRVLLTANDEKTMEFVPTEKIAIRALLELIRKFQSPLHEMFKKSLPSGLLDKLEDNEKSIVDIELNRVRALSFTKNSSSVNEENLHVYPLTLSVIVRGADHIDDNSIRMRLIPHFSCALITKMQLIAGMMVKTSLVVNLLYNDDDDASDASDASTSQSRNVIEQQVIGDLSGNANDIIWMKLTHDRLAHELVTKVELGYYLKEFNCLLYYKFTGNHIANKNEILDDLRLTTNENDLGTSILTIPLSIKIIQNSWHETGKLCHSTYVFALILYSHVVVKTLLTFKSSLKNRTKKVPTCNDLVIAMTRNFHDDINVLMTKNELWEKVLASHYTSIVRNAHT